MNPLPLLSYIAHLSHFTEEYIKYKDELTEFSFPCVVSNELDNANTSINSVFTMRKQTILNDRNAFFLFFIDNSENNNVANAEFGLALSNHKTNICVIGKKITNGFMGLTKVTHYLDFDSFIYRRFKF